MPHGELIDGWLGLGMPAIMVTALYREMTEAEAQVVICGATSSDDEAAHLIGGGRPGDVATPTHWNVTVGYMLRELIQSWIERASGSV